MAKEVAIPTGLAIHSSVDAERATPLGFRRIQALLFRQSAPMVPIPGRLGPEHLVVKLRADMKYDISAGAAMTIHGATNGAYIVGSISDVTIDTDAVNGTNPRYDRIYIVQPDPQLSESGVARIGVVCGTAAASPTLPSLPPGALELGRKLVGATATGTNQGAALTNVPIVTGLNVEDSSLKTFNPSVLGLGIGSGTAEGRQIVRSGVGDFWATIIGGVAAGPLSGPILVSIPVAAASLAFRHVGTFYATNPGGTIRFSGPVELDTVGRVALVGPGGQLTAATFPFAEGWQLRIQGSVPVGA